MQKILKSFLAGKSFSLKAEGNSMLPILRSGDVVYYRKTSFNEIKVNDLVLIKKNKKLFTHRIIYKNHFLVTKGDNNPKSDGKIYPEQIISKLHQVKRGGRIFNPEQPYLLQSTLYFQEIIKIKEQLENKGIDFVFLKGLPLHLYFEGTHPRRIYADCDLFFYSQDRSKINNIMYGLGFRKEKKDESSYQTFSKKQTIEEDYYKIVNNFPIVIDIHFEALLMTIIPFDDFRANLSKLSSQMLKNKIYITVQKEKFPIFTIEDLLLYLFVHQAHHFWSGVFRLEFIYSVIKKENINWLYVITKAKQSGLINLVIPGFYLLNKYYQIKQPYKICKIKYRKNLNYSLFIFKKFINEKCLFDTQIDNLLLLKIKKALIITLLYEKDVFSKICSLLRINLFLYPVYFFYKKIKELIKLCIKKSNC